MKVWKPQSAYSLAREATWDPLMDEVGSCLTVDAVWLWWNDYLVNRHRNYPEGWSLALREACEAQEAHLLAGAHHAELDDAFRATMGRL